MVRLIIFVLLFTLVYALVRGLIRRLGKSAGTENSRGEHAAEMVRDPQCGTYVLPAQGFSARMDNKVYCFCSERCRDEFLANYT